MNHTVSDFIIRIKNAYMARRREVVVPYSKIAKSMGKVLVSQKYITSIREEEIDGRKALVLVLSYEMRNPAISNVIIISKPSLRVYKKKNQMADVAKGQGITLVSTSRGVMIEREAEKKGLGGELLFKIW